MKRGKRLKISPNQGYGVSDADFDNDQYSMIDNYDRYPEMKNGGSIPLYHMAGGGPLFLTAGVAKMDTSALKKPDGEATGESSSGTSTEKFGPMNWRLGDRMEAEKRISDYYKTLEEKTQMVYGGNRKAAMKDPYVLEKLYASTPNPAESAVKERLREIKDKQEAYINDKDDKKGPALHLAEMRAMKDKTGTFAPMTVQQTFQNFEMTPYEKLEDSVGSTWLNNPNQVIGTTKYLEKKMRERFAAVKDNLDETTSGWKEQTPEIYIDAMASMFTDKAAQGIVKQTLTKAGNERALSTMFSNMTLDESEEDALQQAYVEYKASENRKNNKPVIWEDIYDDKGEVKAEYTQFRNDHLAKYYNQYLKTKFDPDRSFTNIDWYDTEGDGSTKRKEDIGPIENIVYNVGRGAQDYPIDIGITKNPENPLKKKTVKKTFNTIAYSPSAEVQEKLINPVVGKRVSDFNMNGFALTGGGQPIRFDRNLELGVITEVTGFVRLPKMLISRNGAPSIYINDADQDMAQSNPKMQTYMIAKVAVTHDDVIKHPEWKENVNADIDPNTGEEIMDEVPISEAKAKERYHTKYKNDKGWDSYWNEVSKKVNVSDISNTSFGNIAPSGLGGKTYDQQYDIKVDITGMLTDDIKQFELVYIPIPENVALEETKGRSITSERAKELDFKNKKIQAATVKITR